MAEEIGLIGIGLVGSALAGHLLKAGFGVVGHDIDPARNEVLRELGGTAVDSPAAVASRCRRIVLSLMNPDIVETVLFGANGVMSAPTPPHIIVDTSTGTPDASRGFAESLAKQGVAYIDTPISGSSDQVVKGAAVILAAGDPDAVDACHDLFDAIGKKTLLVGSSGSGAAAKLATNLVLGLNRLALAEGLVFAQAVGLDGGAFMELIRATPAYSVAVDVKGEKLLRRDYTPHSKASQHLKDLTLIRTLASAAETGLPLATLHAELLQRLVDDDQGDLDTCAVIEVLRNARSASS